MRAIQIGLLSVASFAAFSASAHRSNYQFDTDAVVTHEDDYPAGTAVRVTGFIDRGEGNILFPENLHAGEKTIGNRIRAARAALRHLGVIEP